MIRKNSLFVSIALFLMVSGAMSGCIKPELPNAEADITEVKVEGISLLRAPQITNNTVVMQVNAWDDCTNITPHFTLTEGATITPANGEAQDFTKPVTYKVTSQDGQWTKEYTVSVVSPQNILSEYSFEYIRLQGELFHYFVDGDAPDAAKQWESPNLGYAIVNQATPAKDFPVCQDPNGYIGKCAKLTTKSAGVLGASFGMPIASGSLFLGRLDTDYLIGSPLRATQFGIPANKKPLVMTGYYKYKAGEVFTDRDNKVVEGKTDTFDLYAVMYEVTDKVQFLDGSNSLSHENIVLLSRITDTRQTDEWTRFELKFEPQNGKTIDPVKLANNGYNFAIVMSSSKDGGEFRGAVGSTLMVDEIKVFFE